MGGWVRRRRFDQGALLQGWMGGEVGGWVGGWVGETYQLQAELVPNSQAGLVFVAAEFEEGEAAFGEGDVPGHGDAFLGGEVGGWVVEFISCYR